MRLGGTLGPVPVPAGHPRHNLLWIACLDVADEPLGRTTSKRCDDAVVALDDDLTGPAHPVGVPEVLWLLHPTRVLA